MYEEKEGHFNFGCGWAVIIIAELTERFPIAEMPFLVDSTTLKTINSVNRAK